MSKDQNISLEYGGVHFTPELVIFMNACIRSGIPGSHQVAMHFVQQFIINYTESAGEHDTAYEARRSTYGRKQHLNVYEEFRISAGGKAKYAIFSEYADDPHHRIDATNTHISDTTNAGTDMRKIFDANPILTGMEAVLTTLFTHSIKFTTVKGEAIYGWWFKHEHGYSIIGIDLSEL